MTSDCEPEAEAGGRVSAQSLTSDSAKGGRGVTPPGDEVWAQKCHELDFQVRGDVSDTHDDYQNQWSASAFLM